MGLAELPTAAAVFVVAHTVVVVLVIIAILVFVAADDPWVRRLRARLRPPVPPVPRDALSPDHPLLCSMPRCRRWGEFFWHTRQGPVLLCRGHARQVHAHLEQFLEAAGRE